jgi:quercetin dioxygenase-like cupin family protein
MIFNRELSMFQPADNDAYREVLDKIRQKTLAYGEKTLMAEFWLAKEAILPRHSHPHEQIGYLVSGQLALTIDTTTYQVRPGDSWCIPGETEHNAVAIEESVAIEVFSPVREDYIP